MTKENFLQAKEFIYADIQRELDLARKGRDSGNFLAALGLLCYTEFAGGLMPGNATKEARAKFDDFFDSMGSDYANFRGNVNVYKIFRCGLAHEYFAKKDCTIAMFGDGIGLGKKGEKYYFIVEQYFKDFKIAFNSLQNILFPVV